MRLESLSVSTNLRQKAPLIVHLGRHHFASLHVVSIMKRAGKRSFPCGPPPRFAFLPLALGFVVLGAYKLNLTAVVVAVQEVLACYQLSISLSWHRSIPSMQFSPGSLRRST